MKFYETNFFDVYLFNYRLLFFSHKMDVYFYIKMVKSAIKSYRFTRFVTVSPSKLLNDTFAELLNNRYDSRTRDLQNNSTINIDI